MNHDDFAKSIGAVPVEESHDDFAKSIGAVPVAAQTGDGEALLRGAAQGASMGFADEATAAVGGFYDWVKAKSGGRGDIDLKDAYKSWKSAIQAADNKAKADQPALYTGAEIGGGIASSMLPGGAALNAAKGAKLGVVAGKGALQGALTGYGGSESDTLAGDAGNAALGAGIGAAGGAVVHGAIKGAGKVIDAVKPFANKSIIEAAAQGSHVAGDLPTVQVPGIKQVQQGWQSLKGAIQTAGDQVRANAELKGIANAARKVVGGGESGQLGHYSDDESILAALLSDGDNPVKQWVATKSAALNPGAGSSEDYAKLLNINSAERQTARAFNPREAATELKPDIEQAQKLFTQARGERYNQLQDQAKKAFHSDSTDSSVWKVIEDLDGATQDAANSKSISGKVRNAIAEANQIIHEGRGLRSDKLTEGALANAHPEEQFNRLQKAREVIDEAAKWSAAQQDGRSERLLKGVRGSIDDALKTSPDKVEADSLYSASKDVEHKLFGATEFSKNGQVDIDEGKISKLLGGTDQAKRFQAALAQAEEYANTPGLSPEFREQMAGLVGNIRSKVGVADQQRAISSFRFKAGPSSPAIERLQSASGKNSLLQDAVNAPAGFLNSADEFNKLVQQRTGQSFQDLPQSAKVGAAKFWSWAKSHPDASQALQETTWTKLVKFTNGKYLE